MKIDTKAKYDERYKKRGGRTQLLKGWLAGYRPLDKNGKVLLLAGEGSKPNHEERFANIADCFPLLKAGHEK